MTSTHPIPVVADCVEPGDMRRLVADADRRIARGELTAAAAVAELAADAADRVITALGALEMSCEAARDAVRGLLQRGDYSAAVELTGPFARHSGALEARA